MKCLDCSITIPDIPASVEVIDPEWLLCDDCLDRKYLEIIIIGDQPVTCPKCGSRTDWYDTKFGQKHQCMNEGCQHLFLAEEDFESTLAELSQFDIEEEVA